MRIKSKWMAVMLIIVLAMSLVMPGLAMAERDSDENEGRVGEAHGVKLKDVDKHWARNNVENLKLQGIINGYPDGTFRPEAPVTTAETVVMAVKLLGLDEQAKAQADAQLDFTDAAAIPDWARGYVAVAVEKGLVAGTGQFQPMKKATRMDVTVLLVKTLTAEIAVKTNNTSVKFTDVSSLNQNNQQYIALAVLNDLIKGYDDKSFQPNKPVTRAEMATLFARLQDQTGSSTETGRIAGKLLAVDSSAAEITVATSAYIPNVNYAVYNDGSTSLRVYELSVAANATIYQDNKPAALADLKADDKVTVLLNSDNAAIYIDAYSVYIEKNKVEGQVKSIDAADRTIRLYQYGIADVDYTIAESAHITKDGADVTLDKIIVGDWVKMERDSSGNVINIVAKSYNEAVTGFDKIKIEIEGPGFELKMEQNGKGKAKVEIKYESVTGNVYEGVNNAKEDEYEEGDDEGEIEDDAFTVIALSRDENEDENEEEVNENVYRNEGQKGQKGQNKEQDKEHGKEQNKEQNKNQNGQKQKTGKKEIKLTGAEAADFIQKFIAEAKIGETVDANLIVAAAEKILGTTIDKNKVEIKVEIKDNNREMEFEI